MIRAGLCITFAAVLMPAWQAASPKARDAKFFDQRVAPILERRCLGCHNEELKNGNISFLDRESLLHGGTRGPAIVPGNPAKSLLLAALRHEGELQMPPGPPLPAKEISILTTWVKRGAIWCERLHK